MEAKKNITRCIVLGILMLVLVIGSAAVTPVTGTLYTVLATLGFVSLAASMYYWYRFAAPYVR